MKNVKVSKMALSCHKLGGGYKSPEIKTVVFQPEGVICFSVMGMSHEDFVIDEVIDEL